MRHTQVTLMYLGTAAALWFLLADRLAKLIPGVSSSEISAVQASSLPHIAENPLFAPYKILTYLSQKLPLQHIVSARLVSGLWAVAIIWLFYRVIRAWYTPRIAILGVLLLATSSWFLHAARLAEPNVMFASTIALIWCGLLFHSHQEHPWVGLPIVLVVSLLLYIPGFVWFILLAILWQNKQLSTFLKTQTNTQLTLLGTLELLLVSPLIYGLVTHLKLLKQFLGLPDTVPSLSTLLYNFLAIPNKLFFHGPQGGAHWVTGTPLLDYFAVLMLVLGAYVLWHKFSLDRIRMLAGLVVVSLVLLTLGVADIIILLPLLYILAVSGMAFMLQQWFTVFPRNPVARTAGVIVVGSVVFLSCFYQLDHYFIAWRYTPETKAAFGNHLLE